MWLGVKASTTVRDYDPNDSSLRTPLQEEETESKSYGDGSAYVDGTSFDFDYGQISPWVGPCLYLKSTVGYNARDAKCHKEYAYVCQWKGRSKKKRTFLSRSVLNVSLLLFTAPVCAPGYTHQGHLSDGRTCVGILSSNVVPNGDAMCRDPVVDELREPFVPKSPADMERLTMLMG